MSTNAATTSVTQDASLSVLVVDDDLKLASVIVRSLERAGYSCTSAHSGDEALWALNRHAPDAIVMDVMIPHPSGIEVCRHMRAIGFAGPIIVISARFTPDDREVARRSGATDFLAKPFPLAKLLSSIDAALSGAA